MLQSPSARSRALGGMKLFALGVLTFISACSTVPTDVNTVKDKTIVEIWPGFEVDTSFVGDTVVTPVPLFLAGECPSVLGFGDVLALIMRSVSPEGDLNLPTCDPLGNFDVAWKTSNPAVSEKVGGTTQHVLAGKQVQLVRAASVGLGEAVLSVSPTTVEVGPDAFYSHQIVVLPAPDRLDVPDVLTLAVGETTLLFARVHTGVGPSITTGALVWGPSSAIASIAALDTASSSARSDGRIVSKPSNVLLVKGLAAGQVTLPVMYKRGVSLFDIPGVLSAPAMFQKNVTIIVGASVRVIANPIGTFNDPASSLTPVLIGATRRYRLVDQNDIPVTNTSIQWLSTPSTVASIDAEGTATCLLAGTATIKGTKAGTQLSGSAALTCAAPAAAATLTVNPTSVQFQVGEKVSVRATVANGTGSSPVQWLSSDPTIVSVSRANVTALAAGDTTTFTAVRSGGPVNVVATYTSANGTTITATVPVTVTAPAGSGVVSMFLDPVKAEYTPPSAGNQYRARLLNAQGNEVIPSQDGGVIRFATGDTAVILIDSVSGFAVARIHTNERSTTISAIYRKNGQTIATALPSQVTVYPSGTPGHLGAVQLVMVSTGDPRRIAVGSTLTFEVVVRDITGIQQTSDAVFADLDVLTSNNTALTITPNARSSGGRFFFTMRANSLPGSSAITGLPNVVTVTGDTFGASYTWAMIIVPAGAQQR